MIFRSIVILCALSACAAGSDSVAQTSPKVTPKAPEVTNTPPQKVADPQTDLKRANSLIKLGQSKNALKILAKWKRLKMPHPRYSIPWVDFAREQIALAGDDSL